MKNLFSTRFTEGLATGSILGMVIGISILSYTDYLKKGNPKLSYIEHFGERLNKDIKDNSVYVLEQGVGSFRSQTLYFPTVLKEKEIKDYNLPEIIQKQFSTKNNPVGKGFLINETKHYLELDK